MENLNDRILLYSIEFNYDEIGGYETIQTLKDEYWAHIKVLSSERQNTINLSEVVNEIEFTLRIQSNANITDLIFYKNRYYQIYENKIIDKLFITGKAREFKHGNA